MAVSLDVGKRGVSIAQIGAQGLAIVRRRLPKGCDRRGKKRDDEKQALFGARFNDRNGDSINFNNFKSTLISK